MTYDKHFEPVLVCCGFFKRNTNSKSEQLAKQLAKLLAKQLAKQLGKQLAK